MWITYEKKCRVFYGQTLTYPTLLAVYFHWVTLSDPIDSYSEQKHILNFFCIKNIYSRAKVLSGYNWHYSILSLSVKNFVENLESCLTSSINNASKGDACIINGEMVTKW